MGTWSGDLGTRPINLVHIGLGEVGVAVANLTASFPNYRSVGAVDIRADLVGRQLHDVAGEVQAQVTIGNRLPRLPDESPKVAIIASAASLPGAFDLLMDAIQAGCHVVSSVPFLAFPWERHPDLARRIDEESRHVGVAVVSTGVNPGLFEYIACALAGAMGRVDHVTFSRITDVANRAPNARSVSGVGLDVEAFKAAVADGRLGSPWIDATARQIADTIGIPLHRTQWSIEPVLNTSNATGGEVRGIRNEVRGFSDSREVIRGVIEFSMHAENPRDEFVLAGDPDVRMTVPGGLKGEAATAAAVVNVIPRIVECEPGLRHITELPPFPARAPATHG